MAIQDPDSERRNLTIISIVFIIFYYGGCQFSDNNISLQFVNAHFTRPKVLAFFSWCSFFWFLYRYWLTHKRRYTDKFNGEFMMHRNAKYIHDYIDKKLNFETTYNRDKGYHADVVQWNKFFLYTNAKYVEVLERYKDGRASSIRPIEGVEIKTIEFNDAKGLLISLRVFIECAIFETGFSDYIIPYILAFMALIGPLFHN